MAKRTRVLWSVLAATLLGTGAFAGTALAYPEYDDGSGGYCAACHGDFRAVTYTSKTDGTVWPSGLHDGHRYGMLAGECDTCHSTGGRTPVVLSSSRGGTGLDPIACVGCHGRSEDDTMSNPAVPLGYGGYGAGLRQHHYDAGYTLCLGCHADADPAAYTPVGEEVLPPYYTASTATYPDMPQNSCNPSGTESFYGTYGLDNDGDGFYDDGDTDCTVIVDAGVPDAGWDAGPPDAGWDAGWDAGFDAGPPDAGPPDAGPMADAGGLDAGEDDAGAIPDAGPLADAGAVDGGALDAGVARDAGGSLDGGASADAAPADAAVETPSDDGGCSCSVPGAPGPARAWIGALLIAALLWRRRGRR